MHQWKDAADAPQQLQAMVAKIKSINDRFASLTSAHRVHSRVISCRTYHPDARSYDIHEIATTCAVTGLCNGIPNVESVRDGDPIDWNSPIGAYARRETKLSDVSNSICWIRTQ